jgi:hypothetical protein
MRRSLVSVVGHEGRSYATGLRQYGGLGPDMWLWVADTVVMASASVWALGREKPSTE